MTSIAVPFFTIGHSTRSITEFVDLLQNSGARFVVDVRSVPRSRTNPQHNADLLPESLAEFPIGYEHIAALGGLRGHKGDVPVTINAFWQNQSFHNYADSERDVPSWDEQIKGIGQCYAMRYYVRGGCVVAVPPQNYSGLLDRFERAGVSHLQRQSHWASPHNDRGETRTGRNLDGPCGYLKAHRTRRPNSVVTGRQWET